MPEFKKFTVQERVRWGDVDAARIIFYGAYIHLFEFAETELFRVVGLPYGVMFDELDIWLPRVHLECDFHHAAQLDDLLEVSAYVGSFGNKSMRINFEVRLATALNDRRTKLRIKPSAAISLVINGYK